MKKLNILKLCIFSCLWLFIISCGKEGEPGPTGAPGTQGIPGPAGVSGSQIYNGSGAPVASLGITGDYYIDKDNAQMYGPKSSTGWGAAIALRGSDGAAGPSGAPGSQIHSGDNAPNSATGVTGDFYFDRVNAVMYGPKTESGWGTGVALRIGQVISYVVTRPSYLEWNASHLIDISNNRVPIPQAIREEGIILTYIVIGGTADSQIWHQIPGQLSVATPVVKYYFIGTTIFANSVRLRVYNADGSDLASGTNAPNPSKIRIVMIPADQVNAVSRKGSTIDYSNYEEVRKEYNLID